MMDDEPAETPQPKMAASKSVTRPVAKAKPVDPPAPWDPIEGEISAEEAAGVADLLGPAEEAPKPKSAMTANEILARARAKAAKLQ
jgi:hypothetical protein